MTRDEVLESYKKRIEIDTQEEAFHRKRTIDANRQGLLRLERFHRKRADELRREIKRIKQLLEREGK